MRRRKPHILLTNDDGIYAPGLAALKKALERMADVCVVAPDAEQSAVGHSVTLSHPLRVREVRLGRRLFGHAVDGAPADCVKLGILQILKKSPDLVVSGINLGANAGINVLYSGTVAAAIEGAMFGIPALAVSLEVRDAPDFAYAAQVAAKLARKMLEMPAGRGLLLNLNVPALPRRRIKGVRLTRQCKAVWRERYERRTDPRGRTYYWIVGELEPSEQDRETDVAVLGRGYCSITPLQFDLTDREAFEKLQSLALTDL
ncbi:MAG: 5'/3'-nucleotidase SurE [Planctomycetes bacterium]|nr:5'/3'-nucleotidase SurE [Planctomycetota bacterium]